MSADDGVAKWRSKTWRWLGLGATEDELFDAFSRIQSADEWHKEFILLAGQYEKSADTMEDSIRKAANYRRAVAYYHMANMVIHEDNKQKIETFESQVRAYTKGAKYYWRPVEQVEFPFMNTTLSGYFQKSPNFDKAPCMILLSGADASAEAEGHVISNYFLQKGFSTFRTDLPGQYRARFSGLAMTPDFEKPIGAVVDYLETRSDVDKDKIAMLGVSFGGYIAPRAAAFEKRIKACISLGGFYGLDEFDYDQDTISHLINNMKITPAEWPEERKKYTLDGVIDKLTCALLVINGGADYLQPQVQHEKIYDCARCPKELRTYEGCDHAVWFQRRDVLTYIADWTWVKLNGEYVKSLT